MTFRQRNSLRNRRRRSSIPEINLVPMMDVLMTVLTFFIIISMTLGSERLIELQLPAGQDEVRPIPPSSDKAFIVELKANGEILLNREPITPDQLKARLKSFLDQDPKNLAFIVPDAQLPYEQVVQFLGELRAIGGDRVSLGIEDLNTPQN